MYLEKFDNQEYFSTQEFHSDRSAADHWNEPGHRPRMELVVEWVNELTSDNPDLSVVDYGSGSGGIIAALNTDNKVGYDFCPDNVRLAKSSGRNVVFRDFVADGGTSSDIAIATEVLEHMNLPVEFLRSLDAKYLIMSMPCGETNESHYEYHVWGADEEGVEKLMLEATGWTPVKHVNLWGTQVWMAMR